jgi:hypothetical protein
VPNLLDELQQGCREEFPDLIPPSAVEIFGSSSVVLCDWYDIGCFAGFAIPRWFAFSFLAFLMLALIILGILLCLSYCGPMLSSMVAIVN